MPKKSGLLGRGCGACMSLELCIMPVAADFMFRFKNRILWKSLASLTVLVLLGCAKSQVAERKRAHPAKNRGKPIEAS